MHTLEKFCSIIWAKAGKGVYVFWRGNSIAILSREYVWLRNGIKGRGDFAFVLHGGFTDMLFRKWLAICRGSETQFPLSYRARLRVYLRPEYFLYFLTIPHPLFSTFIAGELFVVK